MASISIYHWPVTNIKIGSTEVGSKFCVLSEWKASVNGGYILKARIFDPYFRLLKDKGIIDNFLKNSRKEPTIVKFSFEWLGEASDKHTTERIAFITDLDVIGNEAGGEFEFVAIDPPSWRLSAGNSNGKVYTGNVSKVIEQVVGEYASGVKLDITKTNDDNNGKWGMMRQDPKTFINSLLEWSSSLSSSKKTNWMMFSLDRKLIIKQQHDLKPELLACYSLSFADRKNDIVSWNLLSEPFMTALQNRTTTQGISAVSGKFIDKQTDKDKVEISDENTPGKINVNIDQRRGLTKSNLDFSTSVFAIPELNGGEMGLKYEDWMDGKARSSYLDMLPTAMNMRITVLGDYRFDDPTKLGVGYINIEWKDSKDRDFFLGGKWLINGFHHRFSKDPVEWFTDLYLYRYDYDANAQKV